MLILGGFHNAFLINDSFAIEGATDCVANACALCCIKGCKRGKADFATLASCSYGEGGVISHVGFTVLIIVIVLRRLCSVTVI